MDINKLLSGIDCGCGRHHCCDIEKVYIESGAIEKYLPEITDGYRNILTVADRNTYSAAGSAVETALSGKDVKKVIFSGDKILVPDETAVERVESKLEDTELIIAIGSGVIQDLCKYVSHNKKIPYIVVATAPSMDGYASNGAAMIMGGMKVTYPAGLPKAIIADTEVLRNAPIDMLKAGCGDSIGKYSALNDWKLSQCVNGEYFCEYIYSLTSEQINSVLKLADGIHSRSEESVKALMQALVTVGILMSFAGSSRPASGSEHHLSHFFEITGILEDKPYFAHGVDVAYSTVITAEIRQRILKEKFPLKGFRETPEDYKERMNKIYGSIADSCRELQEKVGNYAFDRTNIYLEREMQIRDILSLMPTAEEIKNILSTVGLNIDEFYAMYGRKKIDTAIYYAKDLKDRYTVLWLNYDLNGGNFNA